MIEQEEARFWAKVALPNEQGCMLWLARMDRDGYARFTGGRMAHRVAYELRVGPIAPGLQVDHLCRVRHCVTPDHLEAVTPRVNILRSNGPAALNARKTHCPEGHPYDTANTHVSNGRRYCMACRTTEVSA